MGALCCTLCGTSSTSSTSVPTVPSIPTTSITNIEASVNTNPIYELETIYKNCTDKNTPYYSYENIKKKVKVLRVIDGDTVDIAFHHDEMNRVFKYRIRLYGIDTPEKRPLKSDPNRDAEIAASLVSMNALIARLEESDNIVTALFYKPDKYGRLLATFYDNKGEINKWMIDAGYAYAYFGKTKKKFGEE